MYWQLTSPASIQYSIVVGHYAFREATCATSTVTIVGTVASTMQFLALEPTAATVLGWKMTKRSFHHCKTNVILECAIFMPRE
jgi:hypothetical protein